MNARYLFIQSLFLIFAASSLLSQEIPPGTPPAGISTRLEFSEQISGYFDEELAMPSAPVGLGSPLEEPKAKILVEATDLDNGGWRLTFEFPDDFSVEEQIERQTLLLTFDQNVDSPDLVKAQEKLGYLIRRVSTGFNTIYFVAKRPVFFNVSTCDRWLYVDIIPDYDMPPETTRQLKAAYVRLLAEERDFQNALDMIISMEEEYPGDKDILLLHATLEGLLPLWKRDLNILTELNLEHPRDDDIRKFMWEVYTPHSPFIADERQVQRSIGLAAVQVYRTQFEDIVFNDPWTTLYYGGRYQLYSGHVVGIVNHEGNTVGFRGIRNQAEVYARKEDEDGGHVTALAYIQEGALGFGGEAGVLWPAVQGTFNIAVDWHRPYWAVFETLAYHGREDRILMQMNSVCNRYWNIALEGGAHRVGITGTKNGFTSILASGQVFYNIVIPNPIIAINYGLDAEYVIDQTTRIGETGNKYNPVPYTSFENHSLRGYLYYTWRERWFFTAFGGETFNRLGINDLTCGLGIKYVDPGPCGWEIEVSASRFPSTTNQGATAQYLTATFKAHF